ncbi:hypothetical protein F5Y15DRAFT_68719 [Xylariaceae sp. FL0016]|nr:hypothetical protein F5Y15DRAFT_68719 [Xylariaceae sp. FL0016]
MYGRLCPVLKPSARKNQFFTMALYTVESSPKYSGQLGGERARKREKIPIAVALVFSNVIAIYLCTLILRRWHGSMFTTRWIAQNPTTVGISVQIISHLLGMIMVQTLCITLNLTTRLTLASRGLTLDSLKFLNCLCGNRVDWNVESTYLSALILFVLFNMVPSALWAGAITPAITMSTSEYVLEVPEFSNPYGMIGAIFDNSSYTTVDARGTFTFFPQINLGGFISDAREAIDPFGLVNSHAKMDRSGYTYLTRSYGVGSSVGIMDDFWNPVLSYQYYETGFKTSAERI